MGTQKRTTVYFESEVYRALRLIAASANRSISGVVNDAVKAALAEDTFDLAAFSERRRENGLSFGMFVQGLKRRGRI